MRDASLLKAPDAPLVTTGMVSYKLGKATLWTYTVEAGQPAAHRNAKTNCEPLSYLWSEWDGGTDTHLHATTAQRGLFLRYCNVKRSKTPAEGKNKVFRRNRCAWSVIQRGLDHLFGAWTISKWATYVGHAFAPQEFKWGAPSSWPRCTSRY